MAVSKFTRYSCIPGMLLFGTSTVVTQKIIFSLEAKNKHGVITKFEKPWFQTEMMFVGMMLCLVVYEIQRGIQKYNKVKTEMEQKSMTRLKEYFVVLIPALCDMIATCMMNVGLVWISPSIWQMMRGSMIIFSTIFTIIFLKKKKYAYHWIAVLLAVVGLIIVALASLKIPGVGKNVESTNIQKVVAICLVIGAQIVQASQIVLEEFLLTNIQMDASFIVGLEGLWGTLSCGLLLIPIGFTNSSWGKYGFHEDTIESFYLMKENKMIIIAILLYIFFILFYNLFGMMVTQTYSAVYRTILEAVRTACIWVVNLIIYNFIDNNFGERWVSWSFLQLFGFCFILLGSFLYNKVLKIKWLSYPDESSNILPQTEQPLIISNDEEK